jgi:hypothetical protein
MTNAETHAPKIEELEIAELEAVSGGVVPLGGTAGRKGSNVIAGANRNAALGFGPNASQQVFTGGQ